MEVFSEEDIKQGKGCQKGMPGCYCGIGFPYEIMCPDCRDKPNRCQYSRCVCNRPDFKVNLNEESGILRNDYVPHKIPWD